MSRRVVIAFICLAVLIALAVAPWTISSPRLQEQVARQLRDGFGLELAAAGQTTIALLPTPRLKFTDVALANAAGVRLVTGTQLRGDLRLLPLLAARLDLVDLSLAGGSIELMVGPDGATSWDPVLAKARERALAGVGPHLRRLILARMRVVVEDLRAGTTSRVDNVNLAARWPSRDGAIEASATATWNGEPVEVTLSEALPMKLTTGSPSPIRLRVAGRHGEATLSGDLTLSQAPRLAGRLTASSPSLDGLMAWSGLTGLLPGTRQAVEIAGEIAVSADEIALPKARFRLGRDAFDGAATIRLSGRRSSIRATLAGESLDLSAALAGAESVSWAPCEVTTLRRSDIDLRLSGSNVVVGAAKLGEVAGSLLTSADRIEVVLGRATMNGGTVKGRMSLTCGPADPETKVQASFNRMDMGGLLALLGQPRTLTGTAQGQATLEATGAVPRDLMRSLSGRIGLSVHDGDVGGMLTDIGRRGEARSIAPVSKGGSGRTAFDQFVLNLNLAGGVGEVVDGSLDSAFLHTTLKGQISLADRTAALTARTGPSLEGSAAGPGTVVEITGPWDRLTFGVPTFSPAPARR